MRLMPYYRNATGLLASIILEMLSVPASATIVNFSAVLTPGTCTISLNKSTLPLGAITLSQLRANQFLAPQSFILSVQDCSGGAGNHLTPVVRITGSGGLNDGKWLFHNETASGAGILVFQSEELPNYWQKEVQANDVLKLADAGQIPTNRDFTFYAGVSCGGQQGCQEVKVGQVTASLMYTFTYQ